MRRSFGSLSITVTEACKSLPRRSHRGQGNRYLFAFCANYHNFRRAPQEPILVGKEQGHTAPALHLPSAERLADILIIPAIMPNPTTHLLSKAVATQTLIHNSRLRPIRFGRFRWRLGCLEICSLDISL
jgi:hypothetical protein